MEDQEGRKFCRNQVAYDAWLIQLSNLFLPQEVQSLEIMCLLFGLYHAKSFLSFPLHKRGISFRCELSKEADLV